jgi:hypothetical protein
LDAKLAELRRAQRAGPGRGGAALSLAKSALRPQRLCFLCVYVFLPELAGVLGWAKNNTVRLDLPKNILAHLLSQNTYAAQRLP